ncbi:DNA segregation ATPase FtsK/SpoIIIE, S-DNA-T family [Desulfurella multipotens]|uniref:DNA segregation ATPase FtsK/SpoIIIE, S-DNA-T family n=1 Tax=Desulfurella multipotens TaxID=79269 RepID=A0A1G6JMX3_9BACT|nr:DNA translocase FtsK 4TM domain-containing protein [Desulfurella multipotens]SDC20053.1 DNA segregation ATPase FtsK/SpoIIIE, S-DNA-T family [Desulfurella multipotens]
MNKQTFLAIYIFILLVIFLAVISYDFHDMFYPHTQIHNLIGYVGADVSNFLFTNFGILSYAIPVLLFGSVFAYLIKPIKFIRSIIFVFLFVISINIMMFVLFGDQNRVFLTQNGYFIYGLSGYYIGKYLEFYLGRVGIMVIFSPIAALCLLFSTKEMFIFIISQLKKIKFKKKIDIKPKIKEKNETAIEENVTLKSQTSSEKNTDEKIIDLKEKKSSISIKRNIVRDDPVEKIDSKEKNGYVLPSLDLLNDPVHINKEVEENEILENVKILEEKLRNFGVTGKTVEVRPGPVVTLYEFKPSSGIKISKIANLSNDLAMAMKAIAVRIIAPIPGKNVVGIEIPNRQIQTVYMKEILSSKLFINSKSPLTLALGKDIMGNPFVADLAKMPHLLIAGATGAGKSVGLNTMIISILYKSTPDEVKFVLIDPKMIELSMYDGIPHLLMPPVVDPKQASGALAALVKEMETRYKIMSESGVRNIDGFNEKARNGQIDYPPFAYIVVVIDELSDLMMVSSKKVELSIARLAQMARAAGIHLIVATQRPSVDVLTGLIKANFSARISFKVSSKIDSRTILDSQGAEMLLGRGDMLFLQPGTSHFVRVHGAYIADDELKSIIDYVKSQGTPIYNEELINEAKEESGIEEAIDEEKDELFDEALKIIKEGGSPTISYIQRRLKIGYNRSARIVEQMEKMGILSKPDDKGKRELLI